MIKTISSRKVVTLLSGLVALVVTPLQASSTPDDLTPSTVIESSSAADWRTPDQATLIYMQLESGQVVFELASDFAPHHIKNLHQLIKQKYFDGLAIIRSHDNYVAQWGDQWEDPLEAKGPDSTQAKSLGQAKRRLNGEYSRALADLKFNAIKSHDPYAENVGFSQGFATANDGERAWLIHCYGALGVGRDVAADSGNAASLYMVTGHAPRHLDRNITLLGRVIHGAELLSSLPRGTDVLGFYATPEETTPIQNIRIGSELPKDRQLSIEIMRTDTTTFQRYVRSRTFRKSEWFIDEVGKIGVCNVGVPMRASEAPE